MRFSRRLLLNLILIFVFSLFAFHQAEAAKLFLERVGSQEESFSVGEAVQVDLKLDTREQSVNALKCKIFFPVDLVSLKGISQADSIVSYWVSSPEEKQSGEIVFSGIVPGGYNGAEGQVLSFEFLAMNEGFAQVRIEEEKVLLNDGKGTELGTILFGLSLDIGPANSSDATEEQAPVIFNDNTPPEQFAPAVSRHDDMFDGQWFVSFYARDDNLGIDHYEIIESAKRLNFEEGSSEGFDWTETESPSFLKDQDLKSHIYVKAVDKAGNETIAAVEPQERSLLLSNSSSLYIKWAVVLFIVLIIVIIVIRKKLRKSIKDNDARRK